MDELCIRPVTTNDDLEQITDVIHAAYARLSAMDLRFWATYQTVEETRQRFDEGQGLVALIGDRYVGTITICEPDPENEVEVYRDQHTYSIGQFAVDPTLQGTGIGKQLHISAIEWIIRCGGSRVVLNTADQAHHLIELYTRWGYRIVGTADWRPVTNYTSVVMLKEL